MYYKKGSQLMHIENYNNRGNENKQKFKPPKKKKLTLKDYKKNTLKSLNEVESFLNNLDKASKYIHLYKFLK